MKDIVDKQITQYSYNNFDWSKLQKGVDKMAYRSYNTYLSVTRSNHSDIYKDEFQELVNAEYENTTNSKNNYNAFAL